MPPPQVAGQPPRGEEAPRGRLPEQLLVTRGALEQIGAVRRGRWRLPHGERAGQQEPVGPDQFLRRRRDGELRQVALRHGARRQIPQQRRQGALHDRARLGEPVLDLEQRTQHAQPPRPPAGHGRGGGAIGAGGIGSVVRRRRRRADGRRERPQPGQQRGGRAQISAVAPAHRRRHRGRQEPAPRRIDAAAVRSVPAPGQLPHALQGRAEPRSPGGAQLQAVVPEAGPGVRGLHGLRPPAQGVGRRAWRQQQGLASPGPRATFFNFLEYRRY